MHNQRELGIVLAEFPCVIEDPVRKIVEDNTGVPTHRLTDWLGAAGFALYVICNQEYFCSEGDFGIWAANNVVGTLSRDAHYVCKSEYFDTIKELQPAYYVTMATELAAKVASLNVGTKPIVMESRYPNGKPMSKYDSWTQVQQIIKSSL